MKTNPNDLISDKKLFSMESNKCVNGGLSKRELFAAMAMQGMAANPFMAEKLLEAAKKGYIKDNKEETIIAISAIQYADALIAELNKESK